MPHTRPNELPTGLAKAVEEVSIRDVQYTLQVERVDRAGELYQLRLARNLQAAREMLACLRRVKPDVLLTPMAASSKWEPRTRPRAAWTSGGHL